MCPKIRITISQMFHYKNAVSDQISLCVEATFLDLKLDVFSQYKAKSNIRHAVGTNRMGSQDDDIGIEVYRNIDNSIDSKIRTTNSNPTTVADLICIYLSRSNIFLIK